MIRRHRRAASMAICLLPVLSAACRSQDDPAPDRDRVPAASPGGASHLRTVQRRPPDNAPIRLLNELQKARIDSDWRAPASGANVIAEGRRGDAVGRRDVRFTGFTVQREEVGQIFIRARITDSSVFIVQWQDHGSIVVPVEKPGAWGDYAISTDGLNLWSGPLSAVKVFLPPARKKSAAAELEVERLEFRRRRALYPEAAGKVRVMLSRHLRSAVYLHAPGTMTFSVDPPQAGARLSFGLAVTSAAVPLRISARHGEGEFVIYDDVVSNLEAWTESNVALPPEFDGELELIVEAGRVDGDADSVVLWADPIVYVPQENPPRAIVYLIDTLAAPHLSLYGYPRRTSPNLEALAGEGVWFANAFSNASRTVESIPNLMLSLHTYSHGVQHEFHRARQGFETLAEVFSFYGFATGSFITNVNAGPRQAMDQGFDSLFDHIAYATTKGVQRTVPIDEVIAWMDARRDRPALVYVHTAEPHRPYTPPPPFSTRFRPGDKPPPRGVPKDFAQRVASYDGEIAFADDMFGKFRDALRERDLLRDTLWLVTADHGEEFMQHGKIYHGTSVFAELVRVPLILAWPGHVSPRGRIEQNAQMLDVMPTLLDLFDMRTQMPMQGESLAPLLVDGDRQAAKRFEARAILTETFLTHQHSRALIQGRWKLVIRPAKGGGSRTELFDMAADPGDFEDVLRAHSGIARRMQNRLDDLLAELPKYGHEGEPMQVDSEQLRRLEALGYLDDEDVDDTGDDSGATSGGD
ncbi:MAG: sulfatase-like hydrolase/transferase [Phycisphaerae bacterium]